MGIEGHRIVGLLIALLAPETIGTHAFERIDAVHASAAVMTGSTAALIDVHGAILASKSRTTGALVIVVEIQAGSSIGTRSDEAQVNFATTVGAMETGNALAAILVDHIYAGASVLALVAKTIVNVGLASRSRKSRWANTLSARLTASTVNAGIRTAVVQLEIAVGSAVANGTFALVALTLASQTRTNVAADSLMTGFVRTREHFLLAHLSAPAVGAMTLVAGFCVRLIDAGTTILAGIDIGIAGVDLIFAIITTVSWSAFACVQSLAGVEAGSAILAGSVVGAVVQILVAVQASPSLVADASPGFVAGAMDAVRFQNALVAQGSLPAQLATVNK